MLHARYFVLFLAINAAVYASITARYMDTHIPPKPPVEATDIFLPLEAKPIPAKASWYGEEFHGKLTASGERFDMNSISVAHVSLPFGTKVRFFNPANNTQCDAVVNDSGPFDPGLLPGLKPHPRRQFDASRALAKCLGFAEEGIIDLYVASMPGVIPLTYDEIFSNKVARSDERFAKIAN